MTSTLHIADGESVAGTLRESGVPGEVAIYGDLMYEGPAPHGLTTEGWRDARANFLAASDYQSLEEARRMLAAYDETLAAASHHEDTVLWLDHRLTDQLILIKLLDHFGRYPERSPLRLICIGRFPGMDNFVSLGQLTAGRLASLAQTSVPISDSQFRLAGAAWNAFTSADPTSIEQVIRSDTSSLPFLAAALKRHLQQFPGSNDGLSRTERQILAVLREHGPLAPGRLFVSVQRMENPLFMGNHSFRRILGLLAAAPHPLIRSDETGALNRSPVKITSDGLRVLEGRDDHVRLNGIDRWLGGVHLRGSDSWRWDSRSARLHHA